MLLYRDDFLQATAHLDVCLAAVLLCMGTLYIAQQNLLVLRRNDGSMSRSRIVQQTTGSHGSAEGVHGSDKVLDKSAV